MSNFIFLCILLLITTPYLAIQHEKGQKKVNKAEILRKKAMTSSNYIIPFNAQEYKFFIEEGPRPYDVVVLFIADNNETCSQVLKEYLTVAEHFKLKLSHFTSKDDGKLKRPVFFATVKHNSGTARLFRQLDFRGVPNILVSKPRELTFSDPLEKKMYQRYFLWEIQKSDGLVTAKKLMPWINQKTDRNIPYVESIWTFLEALWYTGLLITGILVLYFRAKHILLNPFVWTIGVFVVLFISYAGFIFNILNNVPWSGTDKQGRESLIAPGSRTQFVAEGILMSGSIIAVSILWIVYTKIPEFTNSQILRIVAMLCVIWFIWGLIQSIETVFRSKNSYQPSFFPPNDYLKGPLSVDQGRYL